MSLQTPLRQLLKSLAPVAAIALAAGLAGCDHTVSINGERGKKLSELDLSGRAPDKLVVAGPDNVRLAEGEKLTISVDGDPAVAEDLRFTLKDGTLGVMRRQGVVHEDAVTVNVTMPAPSAITLAGSGSVSAARLTGSPKLTIAGSGKLDAPRIEAGALDLTIAGSGSMTGAGHADVLTMTIAGSGDADLAGLKVETAKVTVAGAGNGSFASDGEVNAKIVGSGSVRVKGRAKCSVKALGSGSLVCEP